jgi:malonyl-CoA O-methyltransferase
MGFDRQRIARAFGQAAADYEQHAWLQREVRARLYERLEYFPLQPKVIVDIGCGSGHGSAELKRRYAKATVIGLDLAAGMCLQTRKQSRWRRPVHSILADAMQLPLASRSVDLLISNLTLQWLTDLPGFLRVVRRVLKPGGLLLFSSFGPDTLQELRQAWASVGEPARVSEFIDLHIVGDCLVAAGFRDPVLDCDRITATYPAVESLLRDLKNIGAGKARSDRPRQLTSRGKLQAMQQAYVKQHAEAGRIPATWEVVYATAIGPEPGQPIRTGSGEQASFPVDQIPLRRAKS